MLAGLRDITIEQGAIFSETIIWKHNYDESGNDIDATIVSNHTGSLYNLYGYTAKAEIREAVSDASPQAEFTIEISESTGTFYLMLTSVQTRALDFSKGYWNLEVSESGAADLNTATDVIRLVEGNVTFSKESTK